MRLDYNVESSHVLRDTFSRGLCSPFPLTASNTYSAFSPCMYSQFNLQYHSYF